MAYKNNTAEGIPTDGTAITGSNQGASGDALTPVKSGAATIVGTATAGEVIHGAKSYKISTASGEAGYLMYSEPGTGFQYGARAYFRFPSAPSGNVALLNITSTSSGNAAGVTLRNDGRLYLSNAANTGVYTTPVGATLTFPAVFAIDLAIDMGTDTATGKAKFDLYNSASATTPSNSMPEITGGNFYRAGGVLAVRIGRNSSEAVATTFELDSIKTSTAYELLSYYTVPVDNPPVVTPPGAQRKVTGQTAALTMTATDPDSDTITSATWANTSRPSGASAPSLTMSGSPTGITATTDALTVAGLYTFTPSATANGLTTVGAVATVYVSAADGSCTVRAKRAGSSWTGAVADLQDMSTSNYAESPAAPANAPVVWDMNPINDGDIQTLTIPAELAPTGGAACTLQVDLLTGSSDTQFATRTVSLADTWQTFVVGGTTAGTTIGVTAFTSPEKAAFTDHSLWAIRLTANQT